MSSKSNCDFFSMITLYLISVPLDKDMMRCVFRSAFYFSKFFFSLASPQHLEYKAEIQIWMKLRINLNSLIAQEFTVEAYVSFHMEIMVPIEILGVVRYPEATFMQDVHCCVIKKRILQNFLFHGTKLSEQKLKIHQMISLALSKSEFYLSFIKNDHTGHTIFYIGNSSCNKGNVLILLFTVTQRK